MSYHTHTPAEWAQMVSLAVAAYGALSVPYFLTVDADLVDFDPRPALARSHSPLWQAAVDAGHDVNCGLALAELHAKQARDRARLVLVNALIAVLLRLNAPKGTAR